MGIKSTQIERTIITLVREITCDFCNAVVSSQEEDSKLYYQCRWCGKIVCQKHFKECSWDDNEDYPKVFCSSCAPFYRQYAEVACQMRTTVEAEIEDLERKAKDAAKKNS